MTRPTFRDGKVHVRADKCSTCIFRPGNPMHLSKGRIKEMVDQCRSTEGGTITCHQTLDGDHAVCRGYWDAYGREDTIIRLAVAMGVVEEI